jgi:S1-C subfamily serine protease
MSKIVQCPKCPQRVVVLSGQPAKCPNCGHEISAIATVLNPTGYKPRSDSEPGELRKTIKAENAAPKVQSSAPKRVSLAKIVRCSQCGGEFRFLPAGTVKCPSCGFRLRRASGNARQNSFSTADWKPLFIIPAIAFVFVVATFFFIKARNRQIAESDKRVSVPRATYATGFQPPTPFREATVTPPRTAVRSAPAPTASPASVPVAPAQFRQQRGQLPPSAKVPLKLSPEELFRKVAPSVATIIAKNERGKEVARGSGFIIANDLFVRVDSRNIQGVRVLTNFHVVKCAAMVEVDIDGKIVRSASPKDGPGKVRGGTKGSIVVGVEVENESLDLAVLLLGFLDNPLLPPALSLAEAPPPIGSTVYAIGNPLGLEKSLSSGIVSGTRDNGHGGAWLQTTAAISRGSSGGPLLSETGDVVGVTTAYLAGGQNLNFAMPAPAIKAVLQQPSRLRSVWEGTSLAGVESDAVDLAGDEFEQAKKLYDESHFDNALAKVTELRVSSQDQAYLAEYFIGKCHFQLALLEIGKKNASNNGSHWTLALRALQQASSMKPNFAPALYELGVILLMQAEMGLPIHQSDAPLGLRISNELVGLMPRCAEAFLLRARFKRLVSDPTTRRDFETAIEFDPTLMQAHFEMASLLDEIGETEQAVLSYERAEQLGCAAVICQYNIGMTYKRAGQFEKAIAAFQKSGLEGADKMIDECKRRIR